MADTGAEDALDARAERLLDEALDELYGLAPDAFLPRRTQLVAAAKKAGDTTLGAAIAALRKPTAAAWAVNSLTRNHPDTVEDLVDLADRLRHAQERLDGATLVELGRERSALVDRLVAQTADTVRATGATLSPAVARAVATTFVAACADPAATSAVTSGRLTRALEYAGFGEVDLHEATARPLRLVRTVDRPSAPGPTLDLDGPLARAEAALHEAMAAATAATTRHGVLSAELELAETRIAQLQRDLTSARTHRDQTLDALAAADTTLAATQRELRHARAAVEDLRDD